MTKKFIKRVEDFVCEACGTKIQGTGYTNHCPKCLFGKHVDINPGDRKNRCLGLMEPIRIEATRKGYIIVHKCLKCGAVKRNKSSPNDSFESILAVSKKTAQGGAS